MSRRLQACKGNAKTVCNFDYASRLDETMLVGNVAMRTGKTLHWEAEKQIAANAPEADEFIRPQFRKGWSLYVDCV